MSGDESDEGVSSAPSRQRRGWRRWTAWLGPGLLTGASDDDPSGIGTYAQAGAMFGTGLLWVMLFTFPLMAVVQLISARIGRVTGRGLAANLSRLLPRRWVVPLMGLLFVSNAINIGADLAAMGESLALLLPGPATLYAAVLGIGSVLVQVFVPYSRYVKLLQWLTLSLLAYVVTAVLSPVDWSRVLVDTLHPRVLGGADFWRILVAVLGTTISPYLFFWQAAQEVEEQQARPDEQPLRSAPEQADAQLTRVSVDTVLGMAVSNGVGFFIMLTAAATLHAQGVHEIGGAAEAARALQPVAGGLSAGVFAFGIVATGLLAVPVLAGSAGYALAECFGWRRGLEQRPMRAWRFYAAIVVAAALGIALTAFGVNPMRALVLSAVLNGAISVPILAAMMWIARQESVMSQFAVRGVLAALGWGTTALMALSLVAMAL